MAALLHANRPMTARADVVSRLVGLLFFVLTVLSVFVALAAPTDWALLLPVAFFAAFEGTHRYRERRQAARG